MSYDIRPLDFDAIQRLMETFATTPYGAEAARHLEPPEELDVAKQMQRSVTAAREALEAGDFPPLREIPNIRPALRHVAAGATMLSASALNDIHDVLSMSRDLLEILHTYPPLYSKDLRHLTPSETLSQKLAESLDPQGNVRHEASESLAAAWKHYGEQQSKIEVQAAALCQDVKVKNCLCAERSIQWLGSRLLLVVRADVADQIQGVHRSSLMSSQEQLLEPVQLMAENNLLEGLTSEIHIEEQRVLRALTELVHEHIEAMDTLLDAITWIDLAVAGGKLSAQLGAHAPRLTKGGELHLERAYHPLLIMQYIQGTLEKPESLSLNLSKRHPFLVVTGPNTGGKTVALKTVGLLTLMAMSGLHIPAEGDCTVGWYKNILVDLGDCQSVYHHLSTFAGHVELMMRMLDHAGPDSLVLFDELGTGTDPDEGAALAMAMLDELVIKECQGMVNTNLSPLKEYAANRSKVQNASMAFKQSDMSPSYKLKIGESGASYGLTIAEKNGLPADLINNAREYLKTIQSASIRDQQEMQAVMRLKNGTR